MATLLGVPEIYACQTSWNAKSSRRGNITMDKACGSDELVEPSQNLKMML